MNQVSEREEMLNRHFDAELDPAEEAAFVQELSVQERRTLQTWTTLREELQQLATRDAEELNSDELHGRIMVAASKETGSQRLSASVHQLKMQRNKGLRALSWGAPVLLAAAAVLLAVILSDNIPSDNIFSENGQGGAHVARVDLASPDVASEVLEVDFGDESGAVLSVSTERGVEVAVVWLDDATDDEDQTSSDGVSDDQL